MEAAKAMSDEAPKAFVKDLEDVKKYLLVLLVMLIQN